jgi:hypothetical protein
MGLWTPRSTLRRTATMPRAPILPRPPERTGHPSTIDRSSRYWETRTGGTKRQTCATVFPTNVPKPPTCRPSWTPPKHIQGLVNAGLQPWTAPTPRATANLRPKIGPSSPGRATARLTGPTTTSPARSTVGTAAIVGGSSPLDGALGDALHHPPLGEQVHDDRRCHGHQVGGERDVVVVAELGLEDVLHHRDGLLGRVGDDQ